MKYRRTDYKLFMMYKIANNLAPPYLLVLCPRIQLVPEVIIVYDKATTRLFLMLEQNTLGSRLLFLLLIFGMIYLATFVLAHL